MSFVQTAITQEYWWCQCDINTVWNGVNAFDRMSILVVFDKLLELVQLYGL